MPCQISCFSKLFSCKHAFKCISFISLQVSNLPFQMLPFSVNWVQSPILALLESSLTHVPYFTFFDIISHSSLIDSVLLPKQQLSSWALFYDIYCLLTLGIQPNMLRCLLLFFTRPALTMSNKSLQFLPSCGFNHLFYHWHNGWCSSGS